MADIKSPAGIVLFAKQTGKTSFSSLFSIKHALHTKKVGHTGTLDSFASGLLVVMVGSLTKLVSHVTAFDKTYEAVIKFGSETDTLDPFGTVIKTSNLPTKEQLETILPQFIGNLLQSPPIYSALHVNGQRASDLARQGKTVEIPPRPITVYSAKIINLKTTIDLEKTKTNDSENDYLNNTTGKNSNDCMNENENNENTKNIENNEEVVSYAHISFHVSKGTYIRCLARDIANACGSSGHLVGLHRTAVGSFKIEDAAGYDSSEIFSIDSVLNNLQKVVNYETEKKLQKLKTDETEEKLKSFSDNNIDKQKQLVHKNSNNEEDIQCQIRKKLKAMTPEFALECGFIPWFILDSYIENFQQGKSLKKSMFEVFIIKDTAKKIEVSSIEDCTEKSDISSIEDDLKKIEVSTTIDNVNKIAVFSKDNRFLGVIEYENLASNKCYNTDSKLLEHTGELKQKSKKLIYSFVIPS